MRYDPEAAYRIGDFIKITLYFSWGTNLLIILYSIFSVLKLAARKYYYKKLRWQYECLKPKAQQPKELKNEQEDKSSGAQTVYNKRPRFATDAIKLKS